MIPALSLYPISTVLGFLAYFGIETNFNEYKGNPSNM